MDIFLLSYVQPLREYKGGEGGEEKGGSGARPRSVDIFLLSYVQPLREYKGGEGGEEKGGKSTDGRDDEREERSSVMIRFAMTCGGLLLMNRIAH